MHVGLSTCMIQQGKSGVGQYVRSLLAALLEQPDCPKLTLLVLEQDAPLFAFARGRAHLRLVPERFRPPVRNVFWHQAALPRIARQLGFDLVHVPSYRRMLWPRPCPLVATIHDLAMFHVPAKYDPARMFYGRVVVRALAHRQDRIIAVSQNTATDVAQHFGVPPGKITVILNGLDHDRFRPDDADQAHWAVARKWGLQQPYFLYVARLEHPAKNHLRLIEAFAQFKLATGAPWQLALGGADWHGAEVVHEAVQRSAVRADIQLLGFVPEPDLPALYQAAGAVVYPSLFEGFGFPPVEAMACGCPVLSSRRGALGEVLGDAAGILEPEDVAQMTASLKRCATDGAWREALRSSGLRHAAKFDWRHNAERVLGCYRRTARRVEYHPPMQLIVR